MRDVALSSARSDLSPPSVFHQIEASEDKLGLTEEEQLTTYIAVITASFSFHLGIQDAHSVLKGSLDTTTANFTAIISCLAALPHWQERIASELTTLKSHSNPEEIISLPLLSAFVKEVFRFFPVIAHGQSLGLSQILAFFNLNPPSVTRMTHEPCAVLGSEVPTGTLVLHETWTIK